MNTEWQKYVSIEPEVHHGEPCVTGTRIPISMIIKSIEDGMSIDEVLSAYPQLSREAVEVVLAHRGDLMREKLLEIRGKLGKGQKSKKSSGETLSEMRR